MKFTLLIQKNQEEEIQALVHEESEFTEKLQNMVMQYNGTDKLPAYGEDETRMLSFSQIECVFSQEGKTWAIDRNGSRYRLKYRLYELEQLLPPNFIRINKSAIANRSQIEKLATSFNGSVDAVFKCGYEDYISRRCLTEIKRSLRIK